LFISLIIYVVSFTIFYKIMLSLYPGFLR
jgi:hypothetical protein